MSLSILTNTSAMQTQISLNNSSDAVSTAMERLSSGLRINSAADDAAGYAISQGLTSQVNGLQQASQNVSDATSMVQTADSALNNVQSMLQRVSELAVQYQNGDLSSTDKTDIQDEVNQLTRKSGVSRAPCSSTASTCSNGTAGADGDGRDLPGGPVGDRHARGVVPERRDADQPQQQQRIQLGRGYHWWNGVQPRQHRRGERHQHGDQQRLVARGDAGRGPEPSPVHRYGDLDRRRRTCPRR